MKLFPLLLFLAASVAHGGDSLFQPGVRSPRLGEIVYFLLPDRFNEGNPSKNRLESGAPDGDPANPDFFHGGDLQGINLKLDYLRDLGVTSIWMSPIFQNRAVQTYGRGVRPKAGYHGYWILDFADVDPHFGSKGDLQHLITEAKQHGIGTILDVVVNHTADVIQPKNGVYAYQYKFSKPYLDAGGKPFDDRDTLRKSGSAGEMAQRRRSTKIIHCFGPFAQ